MAPAIPLKAPRQTRQDLNRQSKEKEDDRKMAMDTYLPKVLVEQEKAEQIVHEYAEKFKDVAYTDPSTGKTGFTALTPGGDFLVQFGFDEVDPGRPGWYYSVVATADYSHSAAGTGMAKSGQAKHLIHKIIDGDTWYEKHEQGSLENAAEKREHEIEEDGVISTRKTANGDYEVISAG